MEDLEPTLDPIPPEPQVSAPPALRITQEIRAYWSEMATWALVFAGLSTLYFIVSSINSLTTTQDNFSDAGLSKDFALGAILIGGLITLIPVWFYYKFATLVKQALRSESRQSLEEGFGFLKYHYVFYGVLAIIYLALIILVVLVVGVVGVSRGGF